MKKGWTNSENEEVPTTFPTFLALWALGHVEKTPSKESELGARWLMSIQKPDGGWGFTDDPNEESNASCTAYALIALKQFYGNDKRLQSGLQWLVDKKKQILSHSVIGESIGGTDWHHSNTIWALFALAEYNTPLSSQTIIDLVNYIDKLFDPQVGGWRESRRHVVNVRSSYWAFLALEKVQYKLDIQDLMFSNDSQNKSIKIGFKNFGAFLPRAALIPLVFIINGISFLMFFILFRATNNILINITAIHLKIIFSVLMTLFSITIMISKRSFGNRLYLLSLTMTIGFGVSMWFITNTNFINLISVVSFILGILALFIKL